MKEKKLALVAMTMLVATAMLLSGCGGGSNSSNDSPAPAAKAAIKTEKGGALGGISFKVDGKLYSAPNFFVTYDPSDNRTGFTGGLDGEEGWNLSFGFTGQGLGTYTASGSLIYQTLRTFNTDDLNVGITSYGGIREHIEGTFSGTLTSISDPAKKKVITDGRFSAWRTPF